MNEEILHLEGISTNFSDNLNLSNVSINLFKNELLGILGLYNSGTSTIAHILTGSEQASEGNIFLNKKKILFESISSAQKLGIFHIKQESMLIPSFSITDNIFGLSSKIFYHEKSAHILTRDLLDRIHLDISTETSADVLTTLQVHLVQICKAVAMNAKIIILDNITSDYTSSDFEKLYSVIKTFSDISFIYITNKPDHILMHTNRTIVMRSGRIACTFFQDEYVPKKLMAYAAGYYIPNISLKKQCICSDEIILSVKNLPLNKKPLNVDVLPGEIVCIFSLNENIRKRLINCFYNPTNAQMKISGKAIRSYIQAVKNGLAVISHESLNCGLYPNLSFYENLTQLSIRKSTTCGFVNRRMLDFCYNNYFNQISVYNQLNFTASGNFEAIFYYWMNAQPKVLVLENPSTYFDELSGQQAYQLVTNTASSNIGVLIFTSSIAECILLSNRTIIINSSESWVELNFKDKSEKDLKDLIFNQFT